MNIKCITIDDEYLALKLLADYISKINSLELIAQFKKPTDALDFLQNNKVELIFLDIQMPDLTGIDFIKTLNIKPLIIFTTAYEEFAIEGFDLGVLDYLVKPIAFDRFVKAVNKASRQILLENQATNKPNSEKEKNELKNEKDFIFVKSGVKSFKINFDEILYIEGYKEYINIYTSDKRYTKLERMKNIEELLPSDKFLRVHKSYIIAINKVTSVFGNIIEINKTEIPIGRNFKKLVEEKLIS
jgi:DNA-binding LytR/AlgR family response regulator